MTEKIDINIDDELICRCLIDVIPKRDDASYIYHVYK